MNRLEKAAGFSRNDVSNLAFLNWEKDGSPQGRSLDYWLEAECQLEATWHLLVREYETKRSHKATVEKSRPLGIKLVVGRKLK
jgi:hypothetical protein